MQTGTKVSSEEGAHEKLIHYFKWCPLEKEVMIPFLAALGLESPACRLSFLQHKIGAVGGSFYVRYSLLTPGSIPSFCIAGTGSWKLSLFQTPFQQDSGLASASGWELNDIWRVTAEQGLFSWESLTAELQWWSAVVSGNTRNVFIAEVMGEFSWPSLLSSLRIPIPIS